MTSSNILIYHFIHSYTNWQRTKFGGQNLGNSISYETQVQSQTWSLYTPSMYRKNIFLYTIVEKILFKFVNGPCAMKQKSSVLIVLFLIKVCQFDRSLSMADCTSPPWPSIRFLALWDVYVIYSSCPLLI